MRVYCDSPIDAEWVCGCKGWRSRKGVRVEAPRQRLLPICRGVPCQDASAILFCVCVVLACVVVVVVVVVAVAVVVVVVGWKGCGCKRRQPKKKEAGGGLGGRAQRLPPRCIGCSCISWPREKATLMFCARSSCCSWKGCRCKRSPGALGVVWLGVLVSLCYSWCSCWSWKEFGCERRRWGLLLLFVCLFVCLFVTITFTSDTTTTTTTTTTQKQEPSQKTWLPPAVAKNMG